MTVAARRNITIPTSYSVSSTANCYSELCTWPLTCSTSCYVATSKPYSVIVVTSNSNNIHQQQLSDNESNRTSTTTTLFARYDTDKTDNNIVRYDNSFQTVHGNRINRTIGIIPITADGIQCQHTQRLITIIHWATFYHTCSLLIYLDDSNNNVYDDGNNKEEEEITSSKQIVDVNKSYHQSDYRHLTTTKKKNNAVSSNYHAVVESELLSERNLTTTKTTTSTSTMKKKRYNDVCHCVGYSVIPNWEAIVIVNPSNTNKKDVTNEGGVRNDQSETGVSYNPPTNDYELIAELMQRKGFRPYDSSSRSSKNRNGLDSTINATSTSSSSAAIRNTNNLSTSTTNNTPIAKTNLLSTSSHNSNRYNKELTTTTTTTTMIADPPVVQSTTGVVKRSLSSSSSGNMMIETTNTTNIDNNNNNNNAVAASTVNTTLSTTPKAGGGGSCFYTPSNVISVIRPSTTMSQQEQHVITPEPVDENENNNDSIGKVILIYKNNNFVFDNNTTSLTNEIRYSCNVTFRPLAVKVCNMNHNNNNEQPQQHHDQNHHDNNDNVVIWMGSADSNLLYLFIPAESNKKEDIKNDDNKLQSIALDSYPAFQFDSPVMAIEYVSFINHPLRDNDNDDNNNNNNSLDLSSSSHHMKQNMNDKIIVSSTKKTKIDYDVDSGSDDSDWMYLSLSNQEEEKMNEKTIEREKMLQNNNRTTSSQKNRNNTNTNVLAVACQDGCVRCIIFDYCTEDGFQNIYYEQVIVDGPLICIDLQQHQQQQIVENSSNTNNEIEPMQNNNKIHIVVGSLCGYVAELIFDCNVALQNLYNSSNIIPSMAEDNNSNNNMAIDSSALSGPYMMIEGLCRPKNYHLSRTKTMVEDPVLAIAAKDNRLLLLGTHYGRCILLVKNQCITTNDTYQHHTDNNYVVTEMMNNDFDWIEPMYDNNKQNVDEKNNQSDKNNDTFINDIIDQYYDKDIISSSYQKIWECELPYSIYGVSFLDDNKLFITTRRSIHIFSYEQQQQNQINTITNNDKNDEDDNTVSEETILQSRHAAELVRKKLLSLL